MTLLSKIKKKKYALWKRDKSNSAFGQPGENESKICGAPLDAKRLEAGLFISTSLLNGRTSQDVVRSTATQ